jgi:hypothetical protein
MAYTFHIDDISNPNAKAFLEYIKTLDFIRTEEEPDFVLSQQQLTELNNRRIDRLNGNAQTLSWEQVQKNAKNQR